MKKKLLPIVIVIILLSTLNACSLLENNSETPEATPVAENQISFTAPQLSYLQPGERIPGSRLEYVGETDDGFQVRIDGQETTKKGGDSFNWQGLAVLDDAGNAAAGVELNFKLRIIGIILDQFEAFGDVDIIITDPTPMVVDLPQEAPLQYNNAVVDLTVAKGAVVPGTTYVYLGKTDKGAEFGGVEGYGFRELADSLDWSGQMRNNVYADMNMRVRSIQDEEVKLVGTATIWIVP
jgi:hypothetical protein